MKPTYIAPKNMRPPPRPVNWVRWVAAAALLGAGVAAAIAAVPLG